MDAIDKDSRRANSESGSSVDQVALTPSGPQQKFTDLGLLDLVWVLHGQWKLLVFIPMVLGLMGYGISGLLDPVYESRVVVKEKWKTLAGRDSGTPNVIIPGALITQIGQLDSVLEETARFLNEEDAAIQFDKKVLKQTTSIRYLRNERLVAVMATGRNPREAQRVAASLLAAMMVHSRPGKAQQEKFVSAVQSKKKQLQEVNARISFILNSKMPSDARVLPSNAKGVGNGIEVLLSAREKLESELDFLSSTLEGLSTSEVLEQPTLNPNPVFPNRLYFTYIAALLGLCVSLLLVARRYRRQAYV